MDRVRADLVDDLAVGAGLLAAGWAAPWPSADPLRAALAEHGPVELVPASELDSVLGADALVLPIGTVIAPEPPGRAGPPGPVGPVGPVLRSPIGRGIRRLVRAVERAAGRRCRAVVPLEIGGPGLLVALHAAAVLGVPCVDGDGSRRGFGRLDLSLFALGGLTVAPVLVSDADGDNLVTVDTADGGAAHRLATAAAIGMGGAGLVGAYPMTAADCARTMAAGSVGYCRQLGGTARLIRSWPPGADEDAVAARLAACSARLLFTGRIVHVARADAAGWDGTRGTVTIESTASGPDRVSRTMRVDFQQGNLVASEDGVVRATVPDLISIVDAESWLAVPADRLATGQQPVYVVAVPADERWRAAAGIAAAGPRRFGYDIDYEPLATTTPVRS